MLKLVPVILCIPFLSLALSCESTDSSAGNPDIQKVWQLTEKQSGGKTTLYPAERIITSEPFSSIKWHAYYDFRKDGISIYMKIVELNDPQNIKPEDYQLGNVYTCGDWNSNSVYELNNDSVNNITVTEKIPCEKGDIWGKDCGDIESADSYILGKDEMTYLKENGEILKFVKASSSDIESALEACDIQWTWEELAD